VLIKLISGKVRDISPIMFMLAVLLGLYYGLK
jgi:hypothetical protein